MEIIQAITEVTFLPKKESWAQMDGFKIITDKQEIRMGIYNSQCCCESWGFFMSEDDLSQFIGAELHGIEVVDTCLKPEKLEEFYEGGTMFVNFNTNRGLLQFTAYNSHNGYYGHEAVIESEQLTHSDNL
jgi:hypothetical protein